MKRNKTLKKWRWALGAISTILAISLVWKLIDMFETWINNDWIDVAIYSVGIMLVSFIGWFFFSTTKYSLHSILKYLWGR